MRETLDHAADQPDSLLAALAAASEDGDRLSQDELFATVVLFLFAGHENVAGLLSNGVIALLRHPDQLDLLAPRPHSGRRPCASCCAWSPPAPARPGHVCSLPSGPGAGGRRAARPYRHCPSGPGWPRCALGSLHRGTGAPGWRP
ncbi:cytochrome P450 [Streptomyces iakyrus]|uniref:cytochrome P450 n=1 Tax=Streptomyces iakyrus TaxID=68219 RepID=UPI0033D76FC4